MHDSLHFVRDPNLQELLTRYYAGQCSDAEAVAVQSLLATYPAEREVLASLTAECPFRPADSAEIQAAYDAMLARLDQPVVRAATNGATSGAMRNLVHRSVPKPVWYSAAIVLVGVLGILIGWRADLHHVRTQTSHAVATYATTNGQRANITLFDGTIVALNVASRLVVPADFTAGNPTVYLTGQALFTVSHHDGTPFTVVAGPVATHVLGTTFSVRHYTTDTIVTVAVRDGKVSVGSTVVTAQRLVDVGASGVSRMDIASASAFSFAAGTLSLPSIPLSAAIPELNRWYDADVQLGDSMLAARHIRGDFAAGSLADLANILELGLDVRTVRAGRTLTLYPRALR